MVTKPRKCIKFLKRGKSLIEQKKVNSLRHSKNYQNAMKPTKTTQKVYTTRVVYTKACQRIFPVAAGTHNKGARQNAVTIPMGGRRA